MAVRVTCSACDKKLQIRDEAVGKKVKCPGCGGIFIAKIDASAAIKAAPTRPAGPAQPSSTVTTRTPPQAKTSPKPQAKRPPPPPLDDDDEDDDDDIDERPVRSPNRRTRPAKSSNRMVLWLVLGLVVVLGGAAATFFLFFNNSGTQAIAKGNNPLQANNNVAQAGTSLADLVPGDSFAFGAVSGELWNAPALAQLRQGFGKEAEAGFEKETGFPIGELERVSAFAVGSFAQAKQGGAAPMVVLVQTKKSVDQNKVTQALKTSQFGKDPSFAIEFLNDQTFVAGQQPMVQRYKDTRGKTKATGILERALTQALTSKGVIVAVTIPPEAAQEAKNVPPQAAVLLKARELFASLDVTDQLVLNASLMMEDAASAAQAKQTADGFMGFKMGGPGAQGKPPFTLDLKQNDKELTLVAQADANMVAGMLMPALQKVRAAAGNVSAGNNLKMIGLGWHSYANAHKTLPPQTFNKGLSWRVAILPYVEEPNLYGQFKLDEPWDSPHNRKLIPLMPKVYALPGADPTTGRTHYQTFVGPKTVNANPQKGITFAQIKDGTSNTLVVAEGVQPVEWTKPDDIVVTSQPIMLGAATSATPTTPVLFADASVRPLPRLFDQKMLRFLIDPTDGMVVQVP